MEAHKYSARRFLVIDDEPFMRSLVERMLRELKPAAILAAQNGSHALSFFKDELSRFDVIISDYNMKPVNGLQLLQAIRTGAVPRIPRDQRFIMLTGFGESEVVKTALELGVNGYLVKPVAPDKLVQMLDWILSKPFEPKDAAHYRAIDITSVPADDEAEPPSKPNAWVVLSREALARGQSALKEKVERFRREHVTRTVSDEIKIRNRRQCELQSLQEGMILAEDIEAEEGVILLRKGTHLDGRMVERLKEIAAEASAPRTYVWIGDLA